MSEERGTPDRADSFTQSEGLPEQSGPIDVGQSLRLAREGRGISMYEASMALKLSLKQVEALETNDWSQLPRTVTRGFVRNYARYLELDAGPLMAALDGTQMPRGPELRVAGGAPVNMPREGHGDRHDYARVVAGLVALLLALLAYFFVPTETWQTTLDSVKAMVMGGTATNDASSSESAPEPASEAVSVTHGASSAGASTASESAGSAAQSMPVLTVPAMPPTSATPAPGAAPASVSAVSSSAPVASPTTSPAASSAALSFSFTRPSWVEVRDRSGQVIFSQTNQAGSQREVSGQPPFTVIVGNATYVTVQYKGKPVNLSPRSRDDVARLTLE